MLEIEEYKTQYISGYHVILSKDKDGINHYVPACYLETKVRIPKMEFCKKCKKELGSIEVGSLCFSCRGLKWDEPHS